MECVQSPVLQRQRDTMHGRHTHKEQIMIGAYIDLCGEQG